MAFTREELRDLNDPSNFHTERKKEVLQALINKLVANEKLTLAEGEWVCGKLKLLQSHEDYSPLDPYDYPICSDAIFRLKYRLYFNNVNGWYPAWEWDREVKGAEKERDINMLSSHYESWYETIVKTDHRNDILQNVSTETRHHIRGIERYCRQQYLGSHRRNYLIKSIVLHSKYMYYLVCEYYEENEDIVRAKINNNAIRIDSFSFIHILFRHYSQIIKEYQVGKSYHDESFDYKNIPKELLRIIEAYNSLQPKSFDARRIYFLFRDRLHAIWFRSIRYNEPGGKVKTELRVQTLYPVEDIKEKEQAKLRFPETCTSGEFEFLL